MVSNPQLPQLQLQQEVQQQALRQQKRRHLLMSY